MIPRPVLGKTVRFERECAHKLELLPGGKAYRCRRCEKVFTVETPTVVDTEEEFAAALGRVYR